MSSLFKWILEYFHARNPNVYPPNIYPYLKWDKPVQHNIERLSKKFPQYNWSVADYDRWFVENIDKKKPSKIKSEKPLDLSPLFRSVKPPKFKKSVGLVRGFDTEWDKQGNILLLSMSTQKVPYRPYSHQEVTFVGTDTYDYLSYLLKHGKDSDYNFFWNIEPDFWGLIKEFLVTTKVKELEYTYIDERGCKRTMKNTFPIFKNGKDRLLVTFLEGKYFEIRNGKDIARFWDIAQFYDRQSLDKAHKANFGTGKDDFGLSNKEVGIGTNNVDMEKLSKRCELDAWFTRELGQRFLENVLNVFGFIPSRLYSQASLSQAFLLSKVDSAYLRPFEGKDTPLIHKVLKHALDSYKGGIFLLTTKGVCTDVTELDIVSAYPSAIHDLPDLVNGEWREVNCPNKNARFGFYHVAIQFDGLMPVYSPKKSEGIIYPKTVKFYEYDVTAIEYWYFIEHGISVQFLDGVEFHGNVSPVYPFAEAVDFCFERKQNAQNNSERMLWKIVLNAMYGKMAQDEPSIGMLFNPVYASYITAKTRLKLRDMVNYLEEVYSFDTDGTKGRLKKNIKIPESNSLGGIEVKKYYKRLCFVRSGIVADENERLIKCRGFGRDEDKQLHNIYWDKDCLIQFNPSYVFKGKECLTGKEITGWDGRKVKLDASYINRFSGDVFSSDNPLKCGIVKRLPYIDDKRRWIFPWNNGKYDRENLLSGSIKSEPLNDDDLAIRGLLPYEPVRALESEKHGTSS